MLKLPTEKGFYVYILRCTGDTLYTGWSNDLIARFKAHKDARGAQYTKAHPPLACVYYESHDTKVRAMKREYEIKQMSRKQKEQLIQTMLEKGSA